MPESQGVQELVLDRPDPVTVGSDGELLQTLLEVPHVGPAASIEIK